MAEVLGQPGYNVTSLTRNLPGRSVTTPGLPPRLPSTFAGSRWGFGTIDYVSNDGTTAIVRVKNQNPPTSGYRLPANSGLIFAQAPSSSANPQPPQGTVYWNNPTTRTGGSKVFCDMHTRTIIAFLASDPTGYNPSSGSILTGPSLPTFGLDDPPDGLPFLNTTDSTLNIWSETLGTWIVIGVGAGGTAAYGTSFPPTPADGTLFFDTLQLTMYIYRSGIGWTTTTPLGAMMTQAIAPATSGATTLTGTSIGATLQSILVTATTLPTTPTPEVVVTDGPSGTIIGIIPADAPLGWRLEFDMPALNSIYVVGASTNPGFTIAYRQGSPASTGFATAGIATGHSGNTTLKSAAGTLTRVLVTTPGSNPMEFTDGVSGTIIGLIPAHSPIGVYVFNMPASTSIVAVGNTNNPGVTAVYA